MTFLTPRFCIEKFSTINQQELLYKLVAVEQRRLGRHVLLTSTHLDKKLDEIYSFVLDHIGSTLHTIVPDELISLGVHCSLPGTFDYELAVILTPLGSYHVFYCFDTKRLVFTERCVPHNKETFIVHNEYILPSSQNQSIKISLE